MSAHTTTVLLLKRSILTEKIARRGHHGEARGGTTGELDGRVIGMVGYDDELAGHLADRMALAEIGRVPILNRKSGVLVALVARRDLLRVRANVVQHEVEREALIRLSR